MASIGILGGTFNPPHVGHLALARHARDELGLDRVALMPVAAPHKPLTADVGARHRLQMCRLATRGERAMSACALEVARGAPSYTAETLTEIHASHPQAELTLILGADTIRTLPAWHEPLAVLRLARLAVAERGECDRAELLSRVAEIALSAGAGGAPPRVHILSMPSIEASSSLIRDRLAEGEEILDLVDEAVAGYIAEHRLYDIEEGERR